MVDPAVASIIVATIAAVSSIVGVLLTTRVKDRVAATHDQALRNERVTRRLGESVDAAARQLTPEAAGHTEDPPTVRDQIEDLGVGQREASERLQRIEERQEVLACEHEHQGQLLAERIRVVDEHLTTSERFVSRVVQERNRLWRAIDDLRQHLHLPRRKDRP